MVSAALAKDVSLKKELVDDFTKDGWRFYNGSEFPGAKGTIRVYINGHKPGDPEPRRAVYDGLAYKLVEKK